MCTTTVYHLEINCYPKICDLAVVLCKVLDDTRIALRVLIATKIRKFKFKKQIRVRIRIRNVNFGSGSDQKSATLRLIDGIVEKKKAGTHIHDIVEDGEHPLQREGFRTRQLAVHPLLRFHLHVNAR